MRTLILEPHFDDTAYSMTGLLLSGIVAGEVMIVTVFSKSTFAPYAAATGMEQISALRYEEHQQFCEKIAVTARTLGYKEAPQRGWAMDNIFDHQLGNDYEPALKQQLTADLMLLRGEWMPTLVYAPLGICGHIDHIIVRECAEQVFPSAVNYYEDLPYAGEIHHDEYSNWIGQLTAQLHPVINLDIKALDERIGLLRYYPSQVAEKDVAAVRKYISMHQGERYWSKQHHQ